MVDCRPVMGTRSFRDVAAILECPHCGGDLEGNEFRCKRAGCGRQFRSLIGIPDLRIPQAAAADYERDWTLACTLAAAYPSSSFRGLLENLWESRVSKGFSSREFADMRIGHIQRAPLKHAQDLADPGWLGELVPRDARGRVLDLGCGPGGFLVEAGRYFGGLTGIDISMAWLVICRKRLEAASMPALLVCACAERLPFRRNTFDLVVAFDAIEHVADRNLMVSEAHRVARPGGVVTCTTPNRFSLSAEAHHQIWGVGLLPRPWMARYVRWRTGEECRFTYLLSISDIRQLFARYFAAGCRVVVPELWRPEIDQFPPAKRTAARLYNLVIRFNLFRAALRFVAPFFRIVAWKEATEESSRRDGGPPQRESRDAAEKR